MSHSYKYKICTKFFSETLLVNVAIFSYCGKQTLALRN